MTDEEVPGAVEESLTIVDVIRETFFHFIAFADKHLRAPRPPAQLLVIWFLGMDAVAGGIELERVIYGAYTVDNWFHAWLRIMLGGFAVGVVRYWVVGTLFHGIVRIAHGTAEPARTSRYIFLYAAIPVAVLHMIARVAQMFIYQNNYFVEQTDPFVDGVLSVAMLGGFILSLTWAFLGMVRILGTDRTMTLVVIGVIIALAVFAMLSVGVSGAMLPERIYV